jgi:PST family polysaccharide transporter
MHARRVLTENVLALSVLQVLQYGAPLITVPYLVRVLGPGKFGLLSFAQGIVLYFDLATDYGFNLSTTRLIAANRQSCDAVSRIFWSTMCAKCGLMCAAALTLSLLVGAIPKLRHESPLFAVNLLYLLGTTLFPMWLFQGLERLKLAAALVGIARVLTVPALFLLVRHPDDYVIAGALQATVELVAGIFAVPFLVKQMSLRWIRPSFGDVVAALKAGWPLFLSGSASFLSTSTTTTILGFAAGNIQVGYFSAADKLMRAPIAALNPLGQALYPHITGVRMRSKQSALALIHKSLTATATLSFLIAIAVFFAARPVTNFIFGSSFAQSAEVLRWMCPLPFLFGLMSVLGAQTMLVFEMDAVLTRTMLCSAICCLPVTALLSIRFGAVGAAAASTVFAASVVIGMIAALRTHNLPVWRNSTAGAVRLTANSVSERN